MQGVTGKLVESKAPTYHGRVGAGRRTAGRWGRARRARTGRRWVGSPRKRPTLLLSRASRTTVLNDFSEARTTETICKPICRIQNPDIPRAGRDGAAHCGWRDGAGMGRTAGRWVDSTRKQPSFLPPRRSKETILGVSLEARTKETICEPMGEQSQRLTRGLSAGRRPLFVPGC